MEIQQESKIIKSGTNEFKLIEFHIAGMKQGINLIKVKKIIAFNQEKITRVFGSHNSVLGILEVGNEIIQIIDLKVVYGLTGGKSSAEQKVIIITEFNNVKYGFVVDDVVKVHRLSWKNLQPVDSTYPIEMVVAVATLGDVDIQMADFEMIIEKVFPQSSPMPPEKPISEGVVLERRKRSRIICCDDSNIIRKKLDYIFKKHSFPNVHICSDGQEAYDILTKHNKGKGDDVFTFMITDIEMPQMDGLTLCKKTKELFPQIPVLVLSSLVTESLRRKSEEVHADAALSKSNMAELVDTIDLLLEKQYPA